MMTDPLYGTAAWEGGEDAFPPENENLTGDRRTEARLCAVQALFQVIVADADGRTVARDFTAGRVKRTGADKKLFALIMAEAIGEAPVDNRTRYRDLVAAHLLEGWTLDRLDPVQYALLWAAAAELSAHTQVGPKVVINEFMNISKGFAKPEEVAFVNAALDRMARKLRPDGF